MTGQRALVGEGVCWAQPPSMHPANPTPHPEIRESAQSRKGATCQVRVGIPPTKSKSGYQPLHTHLEYGKAGLGGY